MPEPGSPALPDSAGGFVFHGRTGRGRTRLATATGTLAVEAGGPARLFAAAGLALAPARARRGQGLEASMRDVARADPVTLDEFGHVPIDPDGARPPFRAIGDCHERRGAIITTNIELGKWGTALGDDRLAAATIGRIARHGRLVELNGTSRRMDEAPMPGRG